MVMASDSQISAEPAFSARLREATRDAHRAAESSGYIETLVAGGMARAGYAALAVQHWFIYQVLEQATDRMRGDPVAGEFVVDELRRLPALRADLASLLGPDWVDQLAPSPATTAYCDRMREVCFAWPAGFIAHHYTRYLGDLSGGQSIRRALVRRYGLDDGRGVAFYDFPGLGPIGAFKRRYRARLDALPYEAAELDRLTEEASLAFRLNTGVFEDLRRATREWVDPFPPEVVAQIMRHMNDDHAADSLLIVRALGERPDAVAARMTGMDADTIEFAARVDGDRSEVPVRIPFAYRLTERAEVRQEVVRMYREARTALPAPEPG